MFGKFKNVDEFLESYVNEQQQQKMEYLHSMLLEDQLAELRAAPVDLAEVKATIKQREADDLSSPKHYQMTITLDQVMQFSADIKNDMQQSLQKHLLVFVAIRYGDSMGLTQPITTGMNTGDKMHFKGQWITKDKAYSHGGAKMSVLHFTHHPYGFTCTAQKCYS